MARLDSPTRYAAIAVIAVIAIGILFVTTRGPISEGKGLLALFQLFHGLVLAAVVAGWMVALVFFCRDEDESGEETAAARDAGGKARAA